MADGSCGNTRQKRKRAAGASGVEPPSKPSTVTMLGQSLMLMGVPTGTNTKLPIWDALRSQQVDVLWSIDPYGVNIHLSPKQVQSATSTQIEDSSGAGLAFTVRQPQIIVQSIDQKRGTSGNRSCVWLNFTLK